MGTVKKHDLRKILIVDDEEAVRFSFDLVLSDAGYNVYWAEDGEEALQIIRDEDIKVIFLDLNLPHMSGVDLCRKIRKMKPDVSITAITGYASHFEIEDCYHAGFDDYLEKPVSLNLLQTTALKAFEKTKKSNEAYEDIVNSWEILRGT